MLALGQITCGCVFLAQESLTRMRQILVRSSVMNGRLLMVAVTSLASSRNPSAGTSFLTHSTAPAAHSLLQPLYLASLPSSLGSPVWGTEEEAE